MMISVTDDISVLLKWFYVYSEHYDEINMHDLGPKYLCLLIAGDLEDADLFRDIFKHKEILDIITGRHILFFLFANGQEGRIELSLLQNHREKFRPKIDGKKLELFDKLITPGEYISHSKQACSHLSNWGVPPMQFYHISEIPDELHYKYLNERIVRASMLVSTKILEHFGFQLKKHHV